MSTATIERPMTSVDPALSLLEMMKIAADNHHQRISLSADEKAELLTLIKRKAADELEFGQELEIEDVRLIRRVTGAVGVYFNK